MQTPGRQKAVSRKDANRTKYGPANFLVPDMPPEKCPVSMICFFLLPLSFGMALFMVIA
jgi:hypothetical protein